MTNLKNLSSLSRCRLLSIDREEEIDQDRPADVHIEDDPDEINSSPVTDVDAGTLRFRGQTFINKSKGQQSF